MAQSLAHRWGQIIGGCFESFVCSILAESANHHGLYLDFRRPRRARRGQSKVIWQDGYGNKHDLDYVLERDGTDEKRGVPVAFIESAWRRYTKHSKNKAQEIEAAVIPVALTFSRYQPFLGAVLAGEFTRSAREQLKSNGFSVLYVPYESILVAFEKIGIDASSEDGMRGTTEKQFGSKISTWESLPQPDTAQKVLTEVHQLHREEIEEFKKSLSAVVTRRVTSVRLTVLHGYSVERPNIESAIVYLKEEEKLYWLAEDREQKEAFEVQIRFNTGAKIDATFLKRAETIAFLQGFSERP